MAQQRSTLQDSNERRETGVSAAWAGFLGSATPMAFKKGQVLFYEGHFPYGVFILTSGSVRLVSRVDPGIRNRGRIVAGEPFGFDFIALEVAYPCTAVADTDAAVLFIPRSTLSRESTGKGEK